MLGDLNVSGCGVMGGHGEVFPENSYLHCLTAR